MVNSIYDTGGRPVNRVTKEVVGSGEHYEHVPKGESNVDQKVAYSTRSLAEIPLSIRNLLGYKFGRLTVIGLALVPNRWVVRCSCGVYSLRTTKAIRNTKNNIDCCLSCMHQLYLRRREHHARTGRDIELAELPGACPNKPAPPPPVKTGVYKSRTIGTKDFTARPSARPDDPVHYTQRLTQLPTSMQSALENAIAGKVKTQQERS
ncbi:hypothetical protein IMW82_13335 [Rhodanobacter sp. B2A1Ga4]|uniref:hypothetical protein n=1 Tax=Rhodanobacter sp. B2A1Ga4 TaxID=2778647 RepID=UPI001B392AF2|nr:hypothetical protein [Rhodanobacter sp. B2A1Ga4]MBQ4855655.1 hypothetical protein [Rhodanobacter sp. B2A1Ga4]